MLSIEKTYDEMVGIWEYDIKGEIDISNADMLKDDFDISLKSQVADVVVDMAEVTYMDSTGLGVIIYIQEKLNKTNKQMRILNPSEIVLKILRITGFEELFCI